MNWKDSFLGACFAALYLAIPTSVVPAVAEIGSVVELLVIVAPRIR